VRKRVYLYGKRTKLEKVGNFKKTRMETSHQQDSAWLTATEAAQYLKVEPRTLLLWARQGKVKGFTLSGTRRHVWRFRHVDLDGMLTEPSVALTNGRIQ
jgi:excisionase family DNA binding protein